jgi:hypothetical protein
MLCLHTLWMIVVDSAYVMVCEIHALISFLCNFHEAARLYISAEIRMHAANRSRRLYTAPHAENEALS